VGRMKATATVAKKLKGKTIEMEIKTAFDGQPAGRTASEIVIDMHDTIQKLEKKMLKLEKKVKGQETRITNLAARALRAENMALTAINR
jgi:hypothetical protein